MKKISAFSLFIILSICLSSCSVFGTMEKVSLPYAPSASDIESPDTPSAELPTLPETLDFGIHDNFDPEGTLESIYAYDYSFGFITVATNQKSNSFATDSGLFLDSCVYERNEILQKKLNFTFSTLAEKNTATVIKNIESAQKNKTKYTDVVAVSLSDLHLFDGKDLFYKYSSLPFSVGGEKYAINNKTFSLENEFFTANEASVLPSRTRVIFINSDLMKTASVGKADPYTLISSKKWTWDALESYISKTYPLVSADDVSKLINATVTEKTDESDAKVKALLTEIAASTKETKDAKKSFLDGEALMYIGTLADISKVSESGVKFGLMPIPVFSEGDSYKDIHNASDITVYAVPKIASDTERAAFMLAAIAECSVGSRANAFSQILESRLLYDNGSRLALGYIFSAEIKAI